MAYQLWKNKTDKFFHDIFFFFFFIWRWLWECAKDVSHDSCAIRKYLSAFSQLLLWERGRNFFFFVIILEIK